jgi:DNA-binding beta-propeller fold protein YncE
MLLDLTGRKIRARIVLSGAPRHLRLERPGGPVLVPAEGADHLYLLSLPTGDVTGSFPTGRQPHDVASASGAYFVGDELANTVHVIRPGTSTMILPGPLQPGGVAASADGSTVMVVGVRGRTLQEINSNGTVIGTAACGVGPTHIRSGQGNLFYIADTEGNRVLVFRAGPQGPTPLGSVSTGGTPYGLAIDQRRDMLYVTLTGTNKLRSFRIQGHHLEARRTWPTVRQPNDVTVDDATGTVIIAGAANSVLQFITP